MAHSDDSSSSCSSVRATLERLRASQNVALLPSKPPDQDEDDSEGQEVLLALARLRRSQSSRHVDHDDTASKSTASSSDHIELAERLKALTMSQKTFSLSLQSQKAWASYRKADVDFNGENEDEESMAHSTTPVSEGFAPSSTGIYFYQDDVNGLPKIDPHNVAPGKAFHRYLQMYAHVSCRRFGAGGSGSMVVFNRCLREPSAPSMAYPRLCR